MYNRRKSSPVVTNCAFVGNRAELGGGLFNRESSLTLTNCVFRRNTATYSGGIRLCPGDHTLVNCLFSGNKASVQGGGASFVGGCTATLVNCTLVGNSAPNGSGLASYLPYGLPPGSEPKWRRVRNTVRISNCILRNSGSEIWNPINSTITVTHSCIRDWPGVGRSNISADPMFVDPDGPDDIAGTADDDLRLAPGSPCINSGDQTYLPADTTDLDGDGDTTDRIPVDLAGRERILGPKVDMGAYEYHAGARN